MGPVKDAPKTPNKKKWAGDAPKEVLTGRGSGAHHNRGASLKKKKVKNIRKNISSQC